MFTYVNHNGVGYYYSTLLSAKHAFATRIGGVSKHETKGLNLAHGRGDESAVVMQNLRLFADAVGFDAGRVISLPQVHGTQVLHVTDADAGRGYAKPADGESDGYLTLTDGLPLGVKSADCVPILLEARDAQGRVLAVAAVHAGWRGTAGGIASEAVKALREVCCGCEIFVAIGPCIGQCCFEVGIDCVQEFERLCGKQIVDACFTGVKGGKYVGDLVRVNCMLLQGVDVPDANIDAAGICTCCHPDRFFSHRYAAKYQNGKRGTMLSVICK